MSGPCTMKACKWSVMVGIDRIDSVITLLPTVNIGNKMIIKYTIYPKL